MIVQEFIYHEFLLGSGLFAHLRKMSLMGLLCAFVFNHNPAIACQICAGAFWHQASLPMDYDLPVCLDRAAQWVQQAGFTSQISSGYLNPMNGYVLATKPHPFGNLRVEVQCLPSSRKGLVIVSGPNNDYAMQELRSLLQTP